jgi:NTP pyrophosphatase (non-canonical NTP hydrolase)
MDISEYQQAVRRTCAATEQKDMLCLALVGLAGELGEIAEPVKKALWSGHNLDLPHLQEEVGDLMWYLGLLCSALGISLGQAMNDNIEKLRKRYPDGFSAERSQQRNK